MKALLDSATLIAAMLPDHVHHPEDLRPTGELVGSPPLQQFAKPCCLFIAEAGQPFLERQSAQALLGGNPFQDLCQKVVFHFFKIFRIGMLPGKILLNTEQVDLLCHVANQGLVSISQPFPYTLAILEENTTNQRQDDLAPLVLPAYDR